MKFEHIKARREPNSSVNFVCMAIEIVCTLESNLLPTTIQTQSNQPRYIFPGKKYIRSNLTSFPIFGAIFCSIECSSVLAETQIQQCRWSFLKAEN